MGLRPETIVDYDVNVTFDGLIGSDVTYTVYASNDEDAIDAAIEMAKADLEPIFIESVDDDEYIVTIGFCGLIGIEKEYTVYADSEEDAEEEAIEEATFDLEAEIVAVGEYDDEYDDEDDEYEGE